jgi:hypothetical protein
LQARLLLNIMKDVGMKLQSKIALPLVLLLGGCILTPQPVPPAEDALADTEADAAQDMMVDVTPDFPCEAEMEDALDAWPEAVDVVEDAVEEPPEMDAVADPAEEDAGEIPEIEDAELDEIEDAELDEIEEIEEIIDAPDAVDGEDGEPGDAPELEEDPAGDGPDG